jgi:hypothetical protein
MQHWQTHRDLSAIRDPQALAQLPQSDRDVFLKLSADVQKLAASAAGNTPPQDQDKEPKQ